MSISFACPECGKQYQVKDELGGKSVTCKSCRNKFTIASSDHGIDEQFDNFMDDVLSELSEEKVNANSRDTRPASAAKPSGHASDGSENRAVQKEESHPIRIGLYVVFAIILPLMGIGWRTWRMFNPEPSPVTAKQLEMFEKMKEVNEMIKHIENAKRH